MSYGIYFDTGAPAEALRQALHTLLVAMVAAGVSSPAKLAGPGRIWGAGPYRD
jgi:hypothetical protein